ncbi:hypothetical protein HK102_012205, partial [Quaeritorhiza haematococci]
MEPPTFNVVELVADGLASDELDPPTPLDASPTTDDPTPVLPDPAVKVETVIPPGRGGR